MRVLFRKIMCATDISEFSDQTVSFGLALANEFEAQLYVCHVISLPTAATYYGAVYSTHDPDAGQLVQHVHNQLETLIGDRSKHWEPLVSSGHVSDEIVRLAEEKQVDLVVTATHGRSGLKRLLLGSVTERLMHTLNCPLLVIGSAGGKVHQLPDDRWRLERVLVGTDFSPDAHEALRYALSLAQEFESQLHLVHVIEPPIHLDLDSAATVFSAEHQHYLKTQAERRLKELVPETAMDWCTIQCRVLEGRPDDCLTDYAQENSIDLIALGTRGYSLAEQLFVGSTTDRVVRRATCPVLSVGARQPEV